MPGADQYAVQRYSLAATLAPSNAFLFLCLYESETSAEKHFSCPRSLACWSFQKDGSLSRGHCGYVAISTSQTFCLFGRSSIIMYLTLSRRCRYTHVIVDDSSISFKRQPDLKLHHLFTRHPCAVHFWQWLFSNVHCSIAGKDFLQEKIRCGCNIEIVSSSERQDGVFLDLISSKASFVVAQT